jgi:hypothetical protein
MQMTMIFSDGACTARGLPMLEHKDFFWSHAAVRHDLKNAPQERGLLHGLWRAASSHMKSGSSNLKKNPKCEFLADFDFQEIMVVKGTDNTVPDFLSRQRDTDVPDVGIAPTCGETVHLSGFGSPRSFPRCPVASV